MRWLEVTDLFLLGALLLMGSWGPLRNLFNAYQDSPVWVYCAYGGVMGVLALICFIGAWRSLRGR